MNKKEFGKIIVGGNHKDIIYKITEDDCYEIVSHCESGNGYHKIKVNGKALDIHRWYYMKMHPEIDMTNLDVRHKCDNRHCINIEHLEHGTRQDNVNDMLERDRQKSKLTQDDVVNIIKLFNENKLNYIQISKIYNVSPSTIKDIFRGYSWSYLTNIKKNDYPLLSRNCNIKSNEKYITWDSKNKKWRVIVYYNGRNMDLKRYVNLDEAIKVRDEFLSIYIINN